DLGDARLARDVAHAARDPARRAVDDDLAHEAGEQLRVPGVDHRRGDHRVAGGGPPPALRRRGRAARPARRAARACPAAATGPATRAIRSGEASTWPWP